MRTHANMCTHARLCTYTHIIAVAVLLGGAATATAQEPSVLAGAPADSGIPHRPDLVTVVPFVETGAPLTAGEATRVPIIAEVDGWRGLFLLDTGNPYVDLNRAFLRPKPGGGVDTVRDTDTTDRHRLPDWEGMDSVHVVLRIGTLLDTLAPLPDGPNPRRLNAFVDHIMKVIPDFEPRLGMLGLAALEPFETIIDYRRRRVVLIRLDAAGHRLVDVPAYTPVWSAPLIDIPRASYRMRYTRGTAPWWGVRAVMNGVADSLLFDTGSPTNPISQRLQEKLVSKGRVDSLVIAGRTFGLGLWGEFEVGGTGPGAVEMPNMLGYPFLSNLEVVGFNHRAHQFLLYQR
jgi:hypothetical protein